MAEYNALLLRELGAEERPEKALVEFEDAVQHPLAINGPVPGHAH